MNIAAQDGIPATEIEDQNLIAWIEKALEGTVERCERQARWRGGWWVDIRRDGKLLKLYVRGERKEEYPPWPLEHEAGVMQVLEKHGIPVPHIYGICDAPHAIVMEFLPGHTNLGTAKNDAERLSVLDHYAEIMAKMHAIDPAELVKIGVKMPRSDEEISLACFGVCEAMYLRSKKRPDPRIEFFRRWIRNNVPKNRKKVSIIAVDSGQFLFENGKVTGLFDFEYGCLGDPMIDVAMIPLRAGFEAMGDIRPFFKRYAELTGDKFEHDVLVYHVVWWMMSNPLIVAADLAAPPSYAAYCDYAGWYTSTLLMALEVLADLKGIKIDRYPDKAERPSRWAPLFDVMAARLSQPAAGASYELHQQQTFVEFARRVDAHRDIEDEYLKDAERLLGHPVHDWTQADRGLEQFVLSAGPEHDEALIRMFYRWAQAQVNILMKGLIGYTPEGQTHIQPFSEIVASMAD